MANANAPSNPNDENNVELENWKPKFEELKNMTNTLLRVLFYDHTHSGKRKEKTNTKYSFKKTVRFRKYFKKNSTSNSNFFFMEIA